MSADLAAEGAHPSNLVAFCDPGSGACGAAWTFDGQAGALLAAGGSAGPAEGQLEQTCRGVTLTLTIGEITISGAVTPVAAPAELRSDDLPMGALGEIIASPAEGAFELSGSSGRGELRAAAAFCRWPGGSLHRLLVLIAADRSVHVIASSRPSGAEAHGDEQTAAWSLGADGGVRAFGESLLSTQYNAGGVPTRVGLELWPAGDDGFATRGSATGIAYALPDQGSAVLALGSVDGNAVGGPYLIGALG